MKLGHSREKLENIYMQKGHQNHSRSVCYGAFGGCAVCREDDFMVSSVDTLYFYGSIISREFWHDVVCIYDLFHHREGDIVFVVIFIKGSYGRQRSRIAIWVSFIVINCLAFWRCLFFFPLVLVLNDGCYGPSIFVLDDFICDVTLEKNGPLYTSAFINMGEDKLQSDRNINLI